MASLRCPTCAKKPARSADITIDKYADRNVYYLQSRIWQPCGCSDINRAAGLSGAELHGDDH